jgi:hypothetical protein
MGKTRTVVLYKEVNSGLLSKEQCLEGRPALWGPLIDNLHSTVSQRKYRHRFSPPPVLPPSPLSVLPHSHQLSPPSVGALSLSLSLLFFTVSLITVFSRVPVIDRLQLAVIEMVDEAMRAYEFAPATEPKLTSPAEALQAIKDARFARLRARTGSWDIYESARQPFWRNCVTQFPAVLATCMETRLRGVHNDAGKGPHAAVACRPWHCW